MKNLKTTTVEIKKAGKIEYWNAIKVGEKVIRIPNYMAEKMRYHYKPFFEIYCLYVPEKNLILTKEEKHRILIAPANAKIYPENYKTIAKDDQNMIVMLENNCDYLLIIENEKLIPLPKSGRRLSGDDSDLRLTELYNINEELFKKGFRMTLIPEGYEIYPKENVHIIAKAEVIDDSCQYDENWHRIIPPKKYVYLAYRNRDYLMIRRENEAVLIHNSMYSDEYKTIKFDEQVEIDNESLFEMLIRFRNSCYFYMNNIISYSNPERLNLYKHSTLPIALASKSKIATVTKIFYGRKERAEILIPGNKKTLFIQGVHSRLEENVLYTIHLSEDQIHNNNLKLILSNYDSNRIVDITDMENDEIIIKKWKYEVISNEDDEDEEKDKKIIEGENIFKISNTLETKIIRVIGLAEEKRIKISDLLKELVPYEIKRDCLTEEENIIEGIRTHERHKIAIPAF